MEERTIDLDSVSLHFSIEEDTWQLQLAKSQTKMNDFRQTRLLTNVSEDAFVPLEITEEGDAFHLTFTINQYKKTWEDLTSLHRNEKLRLLCNVVQLKKYLPARVTFFLHPNNLVFDDNLMPFIIYRGSKGIAPPFEMNEHHLLKQMQCLSIALFSSKYSFEELYNGSLADARETEFERQVGNMTELESLENYLMESYRSEQQKNEKEMQMFPIKRFRLFKQLSIIMMIVTVLVAVPLIYIFFFHMPYKQNLLDAQEAYVASDYGDVISILEDEDADKLPQASKYSLAHSYIIGESFSDEEKESIMKNVSLKSDEDYLLYWIYNGRGKFKEALDKAKYLDDPRLIMYGLIQKLEATKNDPELEGKERDEEVKELQDELDDYREKYDVEDEEADEEEKDEEEADEKDENNDDNND